jgi:hypothetical protein
LTLFLFISIAWFAVGVIVMLPQTTYRLSYIFIFMILSIVNINMNYIRFEKLNATTYPTTFVEYFSLIIDRSLVVPLLILFTVYCIDNANSKKKKVSWFFFWSLLFLVVDWMGEKLNVNIYLNWNTSYSYFTFLFYILFAFFLMKWFRNQEGSSAK